MVLEDESKRVQARRTAEFHRSIWGNYFITHMSEHDETVTAWSVQVEVLKEQVSKMLIAPMDEQSKKLNLIDAVQRLGIAYHFEGEIQEMLERIYSNYQEYNNDLNLDTGALRFRLLRQQGYNVSSDVLKKFKDDQGNFRESIINDVQGMLSLYEASYLSVHGEDILDEAFAFTKAHLSSMLSQLSSPVVEQVRYALKWPIRRGLLRKYALHYFSIYQQSDTHIEALLKMAKLEFNIMQRLHQNELSIITKWWVGLDMTKKLPFVRDRLTECYFVAMGVFPEPQFVLARRILTKTAAMVSIIDDIYDNQGTLEELELFTVALQRWDITVTGELPDYMNYCFQALISDLHTELEAETTKKGKLFCMHTVKEDMKDLARAWMTEARWFNQDYVPTLEEYLPVAIISVTYPFLKSTSLCAMGEFASKEVFDWLLTKPNIVDVAASLFRLNDDIRSHEFEQERGHVASSVECYMKQHGASKQEAHDELNKLIASLWQDLNEEILKETNIPMTIRTRILNFVCIIDLVYKDEDAYTNSNSMLKDIMTALLVEPVAV